MNVTFIHPASGNFLRAFCMLWLWMYTEYVTLTKIQKSLIFCISMGMKDGYVRTSDSLGLDFWMPPQIVERNLQMRVSWKLKLKYRDIVHLRSFESLVGDVTIEAIGCYSLRKGSWAMEHGCLLEVEGCDDSLLSSTQWGHPFKTLILDFWTPYMWKKSILLFKVTSFEAMGYKSNWKLIQEYIFHTKK